MKLKTRAQLYVTQVYLKSMLVLGAMSHLQMRKARQLLAREEGQGTLEYVMLLSGVALVLVVIFSIFVAIRSRAERTQSAIEALPQP